jgi:hypothetical protein
MSLDRIADISVNLRERPIALAGFGIPLIAAILTSPQDTAWDTEYGGTVDVIEVDSDNWTTVLTTIGVTSTEDLYVALSDMFGQDESPELVRIGRRATAVAQVVEVDIVGTDDGDYVITINGNDYTFAASADTGSDIEAGLIAAVQGGADAVWVTATAGTGDQLIVTSDFAGVPFTLSVSAPSDNLETSIATPNTGLPEDVVIWRAETDDWYFVLETTRTTGNIRALGETIETLRKLYIAQTDDAAAQTNATTDPGSLLGPTGLNLDRTAVIWHDNDDQFVDAALVGALAGTTPGSETWANVPLSSVTGIVPTSETNLDNKNYTWLESFTAAGFSMTQGGACASGQWIDLIRLADYTRNLIQIRVVTALRDNPKLPYTDAGAAILAGIIEGALGEVADGGGIVRESISVTVPKVAAQSDADRGNRHFRNITYRATLTGAIHTLDASGDLAP